jgi:dienelactone hydrolase
MSAAAAARSSAEPLASWFAEARPCDGLRELAFEYTSRGDRVPGRLLRPAEGSGPFRLVLAVHGAGETKDTPEMRAACRTWAQRGAAVAAIDLPLHGERRSAKLSARWLALLEGGRRPDAEAARLHGDLAAQARADLGRAVDALLARPDVADEPVGFVGTGLGARLGAAFCADDPRVGAAALAFAGADRGPADLDPVPDADALAPRPVLFVDASDPAPEDRPRSLSGDALEQIGRFLAETLRIA